MMKLGTVPLESIMTHSSLITLTLVFADSLLSYETVISMRAGQSARHLFFNSMDVY